jgi:hypothetical protein
MITAALCVRIWLAAELTNMRGKFDGLAALMRQGAPTLFPSR